MNFTDHFVPLLLESTVSLSIGRLFILIGTLLRNVFSRTETRPVIEKQIGQRD